MLIHTLSRCVDTVEDQWDMYSDNQSINIKFIFFIKYNFYDYKVSEYDHIHHMRHITLCILQLYFSFVTVIIWLDWNHFYFTYIIDKVTIIKRKIYSFQIENTKYRQSY